MTRSRAPDVFFSIAIWSLAAVLAVAVSFAAGQLPALVGRSAEWMVAADGLSGFVATCALTFVARHAVARLTTISRARWFLGSLGGALAGAMPLFAVFRLEDFWKGGAAKYLFWALLVLSRLAPLLGQAWALSKHRRRLWAWPLVRVAASLPYAALTALAPHFEVDLLHTTAESGIWVMWALEGVNALIAGALTGLGFALLAGARKPSA